MSKIESKQSVDWGTPSSPTHWSLKSGPIINEQNKGVYLSVVWMLGSVSLVSLFGIISLAFCNKEIPQALIALGSVAVGALGSLFTHK
jgi:hypothetical protein